MIGESDLLVHIGSDKPCTVFLRLGYRVRHRMSPSLESGVRRRMENPTEGREVTLLVKVTESSDAVMGELVETGAIVEEQLALDYVRVKISEERLSTLCSLNVVAKAEIESQGSVMNSDFRTRAGSIL